jgi:hypothetical protein
MRGAGNYLRYAYETIDQILVKQESTEGSACLSITVEIESKSSGFMVQLNSSERLRVNYSDEIGPSKIEV